MAQQLGFAIEIIAPDEHRENLDRMAAWKANAIRRAEEVARRIAIEEAKAAAEKAEAEAKAKALAERREAMEEIRRIDAAAAARRKPRRCLSCDSYFNSDGPSNRMCSSCRYQAGLSGFTEFSTAISF
jgi:hypothetical protein